jgi:hypothetical protein
MVGPLRASGLGDVNSVAGGLGDGENFVEFRLHKLDRQLHAAEAVFAGKIERPLRVLEIVRFEVIGRPIPQAPQVKLRSHVLKQNFHAADSLELVAPFDRHAPGFGESN